MWTGNLFYISELEELKCGILELDDVLLGGNPTEKYIAFIFSVQTASNDFFFGLFFNPQDVGDIFIRNCVRTQKTVLSLTFLDAALQHYFLTMNIKPLKQYCDMTPEIRNSGARVHVH
jgi:hypothetical protein